VNDQGKVDGTDGADESIEAGDVVRVTVAEHDHLDIGKAKAQPAHVVP
jgi:hypothetical protein